MPHRIKIVSVLLIGTSLCILVLVAGLLWYANTDHCRALVLDKLNTMIPGRVVAGDHHLALRTSELFLSDVTIKDQNNDDLVRIAFLSIEVSPFALFRKTLIVDSVNIENPEVFLHRDGTGKLNLEQALTTQKAPKETTDPLGSPSLFNVIVKHLSLSEGHVNYSEAGKNRELTLEDVDIFANGDMNDRSGVIKLSIDKAYAAFNGRTMHFDHFDFALALKKGHIEPLVIRVQNQFASLLIYGDIYEALSNPQMDLTFDMDVGLAETETFIGLDRRDTGTVKAVFNVKGKPKNPRISLRADYGGGSIAGRRVGHVGLESKLEDRLLTLENLSMRTDFGMLELSGQTDLRQVFPKGFLVPPGDWEESAYTGRLRIESLDLSTLSLYTHGISGRIDALSNFTGKGLSIESLMAEAGAVVAIEDFKLGGMQQPIGIRSRVEGRVQDESLWLDIMEVESADMYVSAGGSMDIKSERIDAKFSMETQEVASLLSVFGLSQIQGAVVVNGLVQGPSTNPIINLSSTGRSVRIKGVDVGNVTIAAGLDETGRLMVETLSIENRGSSLKANGKLQLFAEPFEFHPDMPLNAQLVLSNVEYGDFLFDPQHDPDINGLLGGEVVLSGNLRSLKARADILAKDIEVKGITLGEVKGEARFLDGNLVLDSMRLTNNRTALDAVGEIELFKKGSWQVVGNPTLKMILSDSHVFLEDFREEWSGELQIAAHLKGRLQTPIGRFELKGHDLDLGVQRIEALILDMQSAGRQVTIDTLDIVMPGGGVISGAGQIDYEQSFQFSLQTHGLPIESIDWVREMEVVGGKLDLDVLGRGVLQRPEISGKANWKNIRVNDKMIDDLKLQFGLKDNRIFLEGKHTSDLFAEFDLSNKSFSLDLVMNDTQLAPWFAIAGRPELGGRINGSIRAKGNAGDFKRTRARVDIPNLVLELNGEQIAATEGLQGTFNDGKFNVPRLNIDLLQQGNLGLKGSGDIFGDIEIGAEGKIPLKAAAVFDPDFQGLKGRLLIMTSVTGTLGSPRLTGTVKIVDGGFRIPELQQTIHRVNGQMTFAAGEDVVGRFSGMLDDGRFDIETKIELDGFRPGRIDARAAATNLPLKIPDTLDMLLNADLVMQGPPEDLLVKGEIILLEGLYYKNFRLNLLETVQRNERERMPQRTKEVDPLLKPLRFDIHLKHRQPFVVDNNIAYLDINPDIILRGTAQNPILTGSARVSAGTIKYQNKVFEVQRGAVDFVNPYRTEAEIDIKGTIEVREWRITISLYGPPDRLVVELSSIPQEEDADIISLLVFNKTTYELNEGSGGVDQSPTVLLSRLLAASFGDDVKKSTGIDLLEVEAESAGDENSTDRIKVTVGKDLSERMAVRYSVESKDGGYVHRAATEYRLLEHFIVSGFQDTKGTYGAEFIFRVRFRLFRLN